ncbi:hypothetical protein MKW94_028419 [Papaver nudicaule]|uniref:Mechanosensitive ion channel protein 2/3 C-terminal domain-containing protein n=1 Tax=Papaver nudicaule TaxID=74823 RepID=A0AA41VTG2_PAPNU|nr:hypothetical protein [Papaver nudicaule]
MFAMQYLSRGAPHGVIVSPSIMGVKPCSRLIRFFAPFKIPITRSLPVSRFKVCSSLKLIPNAVKETSTSMITKLVEVSSPLPQKIRLLLKFIIAFSLLRVVLKVIHKLLTWEWDFLNIHDLIRTEVDGKEIFGFVETKGWFDITIKMKNGDRVLISKGKSNGLITKFDHQMKNGEHVNWRFTTKLEIEMDQVERIEKEIYKIFEEDKDLEQEDAFALLYDVDWSNRKAMLLVSCFTKTASHEDYFTVRDAFLMKLHKLIHTPS